MEESTQAAPAIKSFKLAEIIGNIFTLSTLTLVLKLLAILVLGVIAVRIVVGIIRRLSRKSLAPRTSDILVKASRYFGYFLIAISLAETAGLDLSALLGAAGIVGIAVGFAAQTSVSNLISGLFLLTEKAYAVGDVLDVGGGIVGIVDSIDMLSVKLRTFDNRLVRIPNETLVKSNIINVTRYPIRRLNISISITYQDDIEKARSLLFAAAKANPWVLKNPAPFFMMEGFGASGIDLFFGVWFAKDDYVDMKNSILLEIKHSFDSGGVAFAYQTLTVIQDSGRRATPDSRHPSPV
jgi:small-conductance mechanosensitive channel